MQSYYSSLKAAWHLDRMEALRRGDQPAPVELQLILSDLCNQDCHFCAYRAGNGLSVEQFAGAEGEKNPNRMIPRDKAVELLDDFAALGGKAVIFTGGGEPTVHPEHLMLFDHALRLGLDCSLNTNAMRLRAGWQDVLPRFQYIRVSVDAGTPEEYARIRGAKPTDYEKALENIRRLVEACRPNGCTVGAGYVVTPENWVNLGAGLVNLFGTGVRYVRLASMQSTDGVSAYQGASWSEALAAVRQAADTRWPSDFQVVDLFESAMGKRMESAFCGMQHLVLYVGANLKAYRCCYTAYTALGEAGDLAGTRLFDWWRSTDKQDSFESFDARRCGTCPLWQKNEVIAYMAAPQPVHVNFV